MAILSAAELADLRATAAEFFDLSATLYTRSLSVNSYGAQQETFSVGATVACRLDFQQPKPTQKDQVEGGALVAQEVFHLSLPWNTSLNEADRVVIGGVTYAVVSSLNSRSWSAVKRLLVKRV